MGRNDRMGLVLLEEVIRDGSGIRGDVAQVRRRLGQASCLEVQALAPHWLDWSQCHVDAERLLSLYEQQLDEQRQQECCKRLIRYGAPYPLMAKLFGMTRRHWRAMNPNKSDGRPRLPQLNEEAIIEHALSELGLHKKACRGKMAARDWLALARLTPGIQLRTTYSWLYTQVQGR